MSRPTLLTLPRELRFQIYAYLSSPAPVTYPFGFLSPVTSVFGTPPPSALQQTCHFVYAEVKSYFYALAKVRFVQRSFRPEQENKVPHGASLHMIRCAKTADIVFQWNLIRDPETWDEEKWPWKWKRWLEEIVLILVEEGKSLEVVTVSVSDECPEGVGWDIRERMLAPLETLKGRVKVVRGYVTATCCDEDELREWLEDHVEKLNHKGT